MKYQNIHPEHHRINTFKRSLRKGYKVCVWIEYFNTSESCGMQEIVQLRVNKGKLQAKLPDHHSDTLKWWDVKASDLHHK